MKQIAMNKSILAAAALAAISFGAAAQPDYGAYRDSQIQAQQQYQAPQPGSEHYNPELDPRAPQYNPNGVVPGHAYANDPQRAQIEQRQYPQRYDNRAGYDNRYDNRGYDNRGNYDQRYDQRHARAYTHRYASGGYAPEYRDQRYWVRDWRARRLSAPPRGYQWVQTDTGDLLLMALATGLIANVVISQR
jgi:Ni/Co efflux regulator RcnB